MSWQENWWPRLRQMVGAMVLVVVPGGWVLALGPRDG